MCWAKFLYFLPWKSAGKDVQTYYMSGKPCFTVSWKLIVIHLSRGTHIHLHKDLQYCFFLLLILIMNFITTGLPMSVLFSTFTYSIPLKRKKTISLSLPFLPHWHRMMLKVCLRIVCNYACLHTEALLCVKVWKPFVVWSCERKTVQMNFKQLQRHKDLWQTGGFMTADLVNF